MNWRAGRASDVATTIVQQWEREVPAAGPKINEWRNLRYLRIDHLKREIEWVGESYEGSSNVVTQVRGEKKQFDIIILAVGFGKEDESPGSRNISYWRNETYGQPDLSGRHNRYLVSGTGDGGLIDLLRLRIADFREDRIGHELAPEGSPKLDEVRNLRAECYGNPARDHAELFDRSRQLGRDRGLVDYLKKRLRADTIASLQIRNGARVSDAFIQKSSFLNRFLVSLLFEAGGFSPLFGDLPSSGLDEFEEVVVRHGTNSRNHLLAIFTDSQKVSALLDSLDSRRNVNPIIERSEQIGFWEAGWPFNKKSGPGTEKRDYVPDATIAVSSAFVSALAPLFSNRGGKYRATLHRVVGMRANEPSEVHLQQIAHYIGPRAGGGRDVALIGRLFRIDHAVIGLSARSCRVLVTPYVDLPLDTYKQRLQKDMQILGGDSWDPKKMDDEVAALFACPLVFSPAATNHKEAVVGVLFADSAQVGGFDEACVAQIVAACEEFGRYLGRIASDTVSEVISVRSQATSYAVEEIAIAKLEELTILKASTATPPRVPVEHINLEWWT